MNFLSLGREESLKALLAIGHEFSKQALRGFRILLWMTPSSMVRNDTFYGRGGLASLALLWLIFKDRVINRPGFHPFSFDNHPHLLNWIPEASLAFSVFSLLYSAFHFS